MTAPYGDAVTEDTLLRGRVRLLQPARGFRSSLDPVLLAAFVRPPLGRFLDVGAGTGALAFLLLAIDAAAKGVAVEVQPRLAALAEAGVAANGFGERLRVVRGDVRAVPLEGPFDLVATNPPFRPVGAGSLPPDEQRRVAYHEVSLTLAAWLDVAARVLGPQGRLAAIFPAERLPEVRTELPARGLSLRRLRFVRPRAGEPPGRVLFEAARGGGGVALEPPLVVHEGGGYGPEMRAFLGG